MSTTTDDERENEQLNTANYELRHSNRALLAQLDKANAEVKRLTAELADAQAPKIPEPHEIRHADLWPGFFEDFENANPGDCIVVNEYSPDNWGKRLYTGASVTVRVESVQERPTGEQKA